MKKFKVSISGTTVLLTCPEDDDAEVKWEKDGVLLKDRNENLLELKDFSEAEDSGYYVCSKNPPDTKHYLYLKARVCENCMEVDLMVVVAIIIADICFTLGLLLIVYYWSKNRKAKAKPVVRGTAGAGGRPKGQNKERPPPVPNPDYEPIRKGQRDVYAGLNQRNV
ncbi:T-cell surface glycoprotein CD3 epsilon chain [Echinops telfairi]|uniref:T-cell surface glycoprotein CD3 epsilon chain n=1 Tax=Echinops telfairi TaxID=9371 RepID=A0AC55CMQ1_ECHTE|nr:T-cell surface glycoprotein CD3 epsilon chain [Echinops telfairi]